MALLKILYYPDPRLRQVGKPIETFDAELQKLIDDMFETMYHARGVGLAATQVGIAKSLAVMDTSRDHKNQNPIVMINPKIIEVRNVISMDEGCLSVPGHYDTIERGTWAKIRALDRHGKVYELEGEGVLAECMQHEIDHLKGKLYIDYLSNLKRHRIRGKVEKYKRLEERHAN